MLCCVVHVVNSYSVLCYVNAYLMLQEKLSTMQGTHVCTQDMWIDMAKLASLAAVKLMCV